MKQSRDSERPRMLLDGLRLDRALRIVWGAAPGWTALSLGLILVQALVPLATLFIFKLIVDRLTLEPGTLAVTSDLQTLLLLIAAAFGVALAGSLCSAILGHANLVQGHLVADRMQQVVQAKSIEMDLAYYENSQFYDKLHRAQREAPSRPLQIIQALTMLVRNSLTLLGAFVLLFTFHWGVVAAVFIASIPVLFYRLKHAEAIFLLHREKTAAERLSVYFNRVITTLADAKEVRVFGFGELIARRFRDLRNRIRLALREISAQGARRQFVTETAAAVAGFGALAFIVRAALNGSITLGELVMYFGAFQVATGSLRPTLSGLAEVYENNLFLSALYEFLDVPKTVTSPDNPKPMPRPWRSGVHVEGLGFRYPGTNQLVLDGVDMTIRPGETVALVGRNGSGKTTLTKLLCRLYDPTAGRIMIDGTDIRDFAITDLRHEIGVIYQDYGRYQLSARENIRLGRPDIDPDDPAIENAARWAGIHDELAKLPHGYDSILSRSLADGEELSVGQWQKLALARALLRDSQLILLDEPTSSLDPVAEFEFFEKFRQMTRDRSALIISHRFSTVHLADRIYVLDGGRVIEQGSHDNLMNLQGFYADLYQKQSASYRTETPEAGMSAAWFSRSSQSE